MTKRLHIMEILSAFLLATLVAPNAIAELCSIDIDCSGEDACIAGRCVSPVPDPAVYTEEAALREAGYIRRLQIPSLFDPAEECCFDYTGDASVDDVWGAIMASWAPISSSDAQATIDAQLASGELIGVIDWLQLPSGLVDGEAWFSVFGGVLPDGVNVSDLVAGTGSVLLDIASFGAFGALDQFNLADLSAGTLTGSGNQMSLPEFPTPFGNLDTVLHQPRVTAPLTQSAPACDGICTVDETRPGSIPETVGGGKLGGLIRFDEYMASLDHLYRSCTCAGVNPTQYVFTWEIDHELSTYQVACTTPNEWDSSQCPDSPCSGLNQTCDFISLFTQTLDIDMNTDGINDAWSVGLRFSLSGTSIAGLHDPLPSAIFLDGFESGDIAAWSASAGLLNVSSAPGDAPDSNFGLVVEPLGFISCDGNFDLTIEPPPPTISGEFLACNKLSASQVQTSAITTFKSGVSIELHDQFSVATDSTFKVMMDNTLAQFSFVQDDSPSAEQVYNARFYLNPQHIVSLLAINDELDIFTGYSQNGNLQFRLMLTNSGLVVAARENDGAYRVATPVTITDSVWFTVTLSFKAGSGNGLATISINDGIHSGITNLINDTAQIDSVRLGAVSGILTQEEYTSFNLDAFSSWR